MFFFFVSGFYDSYSHSKQTIVLLTSKHVLHSVPDKFCLQFVKIVLSTQLFVFGLLTD